MNENNERYKLALRLLSSGTTRQGRFCPDKGIKLIHEKIQSADVSIRCMNMMVGESREDTKGKLKVKTFLDLEEQLDDLLCILDHIHNSLNVLLDDVKA